jgi:hypothetical protein
MNDNGHEPVLIYDFGPEGSIISHEACRLCGKPLKVVNDFGVSEPCPAKSPDRPGDATDEPELALNKAPGCIAWTAVLLGLGVALVLAGVMLAQILHTYTR